MTAFKMDRPAARSSVGKLNQRPAGDSTGG